MFVRARAGVSTGTGEAHSALIKAKGTFWSNWSYICVDHAKVARRERDALVAGWAGTSHDAERMLAEMNASLVAVAAAAFALEAFHADIAPSLGREADARVGRGKARGYILATFREAMPAAGRWQRDIEWLFKARDAEVHFVGEFAPLVRHPAIPTNVALETVTFSVEAAERAVDLLIRFWTHLFQGRTVDRLQSWVSQRDSVLLPFLEYAAQPAA